MDFFKRVKDILKQENISFEDKVVVELINKCFPDWRRTLNELQRYSTSGKIDAGILVNLSEVNVNELIEALRRKDLQSTRKWIVNNLDNDHNRIFRTIYDTLLMHLSDDTSIKYAVHTIGEYQYKAAFVADQEINLLACMVVLMSEVKFK